MALINLWRFGPAQGDGLKRLFPFQGGLIQAGLSGMGEIWGNHPSAPSCAVMRVGDFLFLGGKPVHPQEGVRLLSRLRGAPSEEWLARGDAVWEQSLRLAGRWKLGAATRTAFFPHAPFQPDRLRAYIRDLPPGVALCPIDGPLYRACMERAWSRDFCSLYRDERDYLLRGRGILAVKGRELLSGASSYVSYPGGVEIQVETREDQRRRGLARACCARLILECLENGIDPTWDAANPASERLAIVLGYQVKERYPVWTLTEK